MRRALIVADVGALVAAFGIAQWLFGPAANGGDRVSLPIESLVFALTLPGWVLAAKLHGLYDKDEVRASHTVSDEVTGVFHLVTAGVWLLTAGAWLGGYTEVNPPKVLSFWLLAFLLIPICRAAARGVSRRTPSYRQNTLIVGAGDVGQLVARKILNHPEYGLDVVGFVDARPRDLRVECSAIPVLGEPADLGSVVDRYEIDRVVIAFSTADEQDIVEILRSPAARFVHVDIVPRLFGVVGPAVGVHTVEGLTLIGLQTPGQAGVSRIIKRVIDVVGATMVLVAAAPLMAFVAWRIRSTSEGPAFFRQTRVGLRGAEFEVLKFRTMKAGDNSAGHRAHIRSHDEADAGLYKLDRGDVVTPTGRWLRRSSLDELPQLINVLRGEMSLVGPRPCIPYELEQLLPHQYARFSVPPGITGLWQVVARAHSTYQEALEMDVVYARDWSLGLDLRLLCRTPLAVIRQRGATR